MKNKKLGKRKGIFQWNRNWICSCPEMWLMPFDILRCGACGATDNYHKPGNMTGRYRKGKAKLSTYS